jgi:hypothetical protein
MNRRNFLRLLAGAAAAPAVTYFLPPIGGWKSDVIVNPFASPPWMAGDQIIADPSLWGLPFYVSNIGGPFSGIARSAAPSRQAGRRISL